MDDRLGEYQASTALVKSTLAASDTAARMDSRPRPHEVLTAGYLAATGVLGAALGSLAEWWPTLVAHAVAIFIILVVFPRLPARRSVEAFRDWLPVIALPLLYAEVAHLNQLLSIGYYDGTIQAVERALFGGPAGPALRHVLPWKPVVEYLHFSYAAYYLLLPILGGALYLRGKRREFRYVLAVVLGTFYVCYFCFIVFPVAGPWYRPHAYAASASGIFPVLVQGVLTRWASKGAAFPSSHVAVAVVIWLLAWRFARRVFWLLAAIVPALALGTVYGGFHYALDAGAGMLVGVAGYLAGPRVHRMLGGEAGDAEPGY